MMKAGPDEGGGQEARGEQGGVPERTPAQAAVEEGGDGVDRDGPDDGEEHERHVPARVGALAEEALVEQVAADVQVDQQIAQSTMTSQVSMENGKVEPSPGRAAGARSGRDARGRTVTKNQADTDGGDGEQFPDDDDVVHGCSS
jgi:hypothetical protein